MLLDVIDCSRFLFDAPLSSPFAHPTSSPHNSRLLFRNPMFNIPKTDLAFVPLSLPKDGEDLISGRQYEIDPVARAVIYNHYGVKTPRFVECINAKSPGRTVTIHTEYADKRPTKDIVHVYPEVDATFRAFFKYKKIAKFTLDLTVVEYQRQFYKEAHLAPDLEDDEDSERYNERNASPKVRIGKKALTLDELMAL